MQIVRTSHRFVFLAFSLGFVSSATADEPIRWTFKPGVELHYKIDQEMTIANVEGGVDKLQSKTHQQLEVTWQVKGVNDAGDGVIEYKFDRIRSQMTLPTGHLEYDSVKEGPPAGMAAINAPLYAALVKAPVEFTLSPTGITQSVTLPDAVKTALKKVQTAASIGDLAKPDVFHTLFLPGFPLLPTGPVEPGAQWSTGTTANLAAAGKQSIETLYHYKYSDPCAMIDVTRTIGFEPGDASQRRVKEQSSTGDVVFGYPPGSLYSSSLKHHATITVTVANREAEQKIDQSINVENISPKDAEAEKKSGGAGAK